MSQSPRASIRPRHHTRAAFAATAAVAAALAGGACSPPPVVPHDDVPTADATPDTAPSFDAAPDGPSMLMPDSASDAGTSRDVTPPPDVMPPPDGGPPLGAIDQMDLLLEVDNSNSMRENQSNLMAQLGPMVAQLTDPPCTSAANPAPHRCDPANPADRRVRPPVRDLHVGVIDSDLGTPGSSVPGCANSDGGDDGLLNPIRYGAALRAHEPWVSAPAGFRPADCTDPNAFPNFIAYDSRRAGEAGYTTGFEHDFRCNAGLYVNGCGLEQQLESIWRALVWHDASDRAGNTDPNAGFLRRDAVLAIVLLTDEEDGSVRDCRFARGAACTNAIDAFNSASSAWSSMNLNLRDYMYTPGSAQDPTWPLDRYVDPRDATHGLLALKPGHPERVVFAAITGVPVDLPHHADGTTDWDALLGAPGANPDDFTARNSATAVTTMTPEGPISMRQANPDPACVDRTVPACRRPGTPYNPASPPCTTTEQYFAWPARRIVEVARRFDQARLCGGMACNNGIVRSICGTDYAPAITEIVTRVGSRLVVPG